MLYLATNDGQSAISPPSTNESLDSLARRLRDSDHAAFETIFRRMNQPLLRYAVRFVQNDAGALDILQDVFLKLWEKRASLEIIVSFNALLYTMIRNRALNIKRQEAKFAGGELYAQFQPSTPDHIIADSQLTAQQLDRFFRRCVSELPPRRAEAFILSRYHDLSHHEIAIVMGLSKRTVDTHIVHALRHLRQRYEAIQSKGTLS